MKKAARAIALGSMVLVGVAAISQSAVALTADEVAAQYATLGYQITEIELSRRGTVFEIQAMIDGAKVELKVNADTGELISVEADTDDPSATEVEEPSHESDGSKESEHEDSDDSDDDSGDHSGSGSGSHD
jgi:hypothetical protein